MAREWTPEQIRAIECTDRTVLLSAAAGSGKTATLTERLIRMITDKEHPLDVSRMVVVTFTRAAAAELRERIAKALEEALATDPHNEHLLRSSLLLPSAIIRTIDSFCNDLVRGNAESLGIVPHYRIADSAEKKLMTEALMDALITDAFDGTFRAEGLDVAYLTECATEARTEKDLAPILLSLYAELEGYPDGIELLKKSLELLSASAEAGADFSYFETPWGKCVQEHLLETFRFYVEALKRAREDALLSADTVFSSKLAPLFAVYEAFAQDAYAAVGKSYTAAKLALKDPSLPILRSSNDLTEEARLAKACASRFSDTVKKIFPRFFAWEEADIPYAAKESARLLKTILLLLEEFDRRFASEKKRAGLCTYADLERYAYRLLYDEKGEKTPLAKELRDSFDAVCIDEYQDVNDLQHLIFEAISTERNRFMVGDIKQSIYAFRGAKPAIFADLRSSFPTYEEDKERTVLYLTKNFRSHGHLIDFNNAVFDFLFGNFGDGIGYRAEDALQTGKKAPEHPLPVPELYYIYMPRGSEDKRTEWDAIAAKIENLLKSGKKDDQTPLKPSDIAVLYRSGSAKPQEISRALRTCGIPVCAKDTRNFFENAEILLALCLLQTVNNPRRDIYLSGLLRSPLYHFTMDELIEVRNADKTTLFDALVSYTEKHPDFEKGARFLSELARFRRLSEGERSDKLCRLLFEETGLYTAASSEGKKRLHLLTDCAAQYENNSFHGLYRFLSYLSEIYESGVSLGAERIYGEAEGVKIMTMHASKGLEFPVTIVADTMPYEKTSKPKLLFHPSLGAVLSIRDPSGLALLENPFYTAVEQLIERESVEEEIRVLYVALTRASEQMYITSHHGTKTENVLDDVALLSAFPSRTLLAESSPFAWILSSMLSRRDLCQAHLGTNTEIFSVLSPIEEENENQEACAAACTAQESANVSLEAVEAFRKEFKERFSFVYPHAAQTKLPGKVSVSKLYPAYLDEDTLTERASDAFEKAADEKKTKTVPFFLSGIEDRAAAKAGIATHVFLQFCDFSALCGNSREDIRAAIEKEIQRLIDAGFIHPSDASRIRIQEIVDFVNSDLQKDILSAKSIRREFRFNVYLPAHLFTETDKESYKDLSVFTQGVIDLLIETEEGEIILADYKTDRLTPEMLANRKKAEEMLLSRHATQLFYYAAAIEKIFGKAPKQVKIYSLHAGESFLVPLSP